MAGTELVIQRGSSVTCFLNGNVCTVQLGGAKGKQSAYPVRTCLGCGVKSNKAELFRLVLSAGLLVADRMQVMPGRGAYCCRNIQCYQRLVKQRKKLAWALRYHKTEKAVGFDISQGLDAEFSTMHTVRRETFSK